MPLQPVALHWLRELEQLKRAAGNVGWPRWFQIQLERKQRALAKWQRGAQNRVGLCHLQGIYLQRMPQERPA